MAAGRFEEAVWVPDMRAQGLRLRWSPLQVLLPRPNSDSCAGGGSGLRVPVLRRGIQREAPR